MQGGSRVCSCYGNELGVCCWAMYTDCPYYVYLYGRGASVLLTAPFLQIEYVVTHASIYLHSVDGELFIRGPIKRSQVVEFRLEGLKSLPRIS